MYFIDCRLSNVSHDVMEILADYMDGTVDGNIELLICNEGKRKCHTPV